FASLASGAEADRREVRKVVNKFAHPAKQQRCVNERLRETMARLHGAATHQKWALLAETAAGMATQSWAAELRDLDSLSRLQRLQVLEKHASVRRYRHLWEAQGPRSRSEEAIAQGAVSRRRGAAVEANAARALQALAK